MNRARIAVFACALLAATTFGAGCGGRAASRGSTPTSPTTLATGALPLEISAADAFGLVQTNRTNPDFVILDVRTAGEFASGHLTAAIELDYLSPDFRSVIGGLATGKRYLVYCQSGVRGRGATQIMVNLAFTEVQNLTGGLDEWLQEGYPIATPPAPVPLPTAIAALDAYALVQSNRNNPGFVILDVRTAAEFAGGHLAGAINIDYYSADFRSRILALDAAKRYLVYCRSGVRGAAATAIMGELGFARVQNLTGGLDQWIQDAYPTVM